MQDCNATLTVCATTDDVVTRMWPDSCHPEGFRARDIPDGVAVVRDGDHLKRLDRPVLTCQLGREHVTHEAWDGNSNPASWNDSAPGAASHADNTDLLTATDREQSDG